MRPLPFDATFDALAWIVGQVGLGAAAPAMADLVPALYCCRNSMAWDEPTRRIVESVPYEHYQIGWYRLEDLSDAIPADVWGRRVFVHRQTLSGLAGRRLVVVTVDSGGRVNEGAGKQLLVAVDRAA